MKATRTTLVRDLAELGLTRGDAVMVHASLRAVGPVLGGVNMVVQALLDTVAEDGLLAAYLDWETGVEDEEWESAAPEDIPVFDTRTAKAARDHGILHETIRTWPGAVRSDHPDAGVVAIGKRAQWLTSPHPFRHGYGEGTPFSRFVEAGGKVLMLGAPLDTITLLHHAEHRAQIPDKRVVRYRRLMQPGPRWVDFEEFDTGDPVNERLPLNVFEQIAEDFLKGGKGRRGRVGDAESSLFDGPELVAFGVGWIERFLETAGA